MTELCSLAEVELMVTKRYLKFQSNTSKGVGYKWAGTKKLTELLCRKRDIILSKFRIELCPLA